MTITKEEVRYVAELARLKISDDEVGKYQSQLEAILEHAASIASIDTTGIIPTSHPLPMSNVFRADKVGSCLTQSEVLSNAPASEDGRFVVPQILEDE